jgi:hypothetical protein|tara:strand:+ start:164 stop:550 length:387 start_codon:yes stop_codon:yes gene_type:complete
MESAIPHGEYELMKKDMLDMSDKGFTPKEIAKFLTDKYKDTTGRLITRNMVIGVKWRAGKCDGHKSLEKQTDVDQMSDEELEHKGLHKRKCLSCLKEKVMEKHFRICDKCKSTNLYKSDNGGSYSVTM